MLSQQNTLGQSIFTGIEKNEYLNEIIDALLHDYCIDLFAISGVEKKGVNIDDALRFADLLSKSANAEKSELHQSMAQELIMLLDAVYPDNEEIKYVMGSVLTSTSNYLGLQHSVPDYHSASVLDQLATETDKAILQIPSEKNHYFLKSQKMVYDHMTSDSCFSYSGPTSMGKSFVMRTFIKEQIKQSGDINFAIVVPSKALINEVSREITESLGSMLRQYDYRVVTSAGAVILQDKNAHNYIFVMTPERLLYLLIGYREIPIHYLFVDEAQNISEKGGRSAFYYQIISMLHRQEPHPCVIFASPNIPNPDVYLELIPGSRVGMRAKMTSAYTPVSQEKFLLDLQTRSLGYFNSITQELQIVADIAPDRSLFSYIDDIGHEKKNLVYCNAKAKVVMFAREYAATQPISNDPDLLSLAAEIRELIHDDYYLAETVERGVAFHVGYLPTSIRLRIEETFRRREGGINTIFCTSTLLEGVNLPADNLFITDFRNGKNQMSAVEFRNLIGRVGRIQYALYGNAFFVCLPDSSIVPNNYVALLKKEVDVQTLSVGTISEEAKNYVIACLLKGQTKLESLEKQPAEEYSLMRKAANILLRDIMLGKRSRISQEFASLLTPSVISTIKLQFSGRTNEPDDDINVSVDQIDRLSLAIANGLDYPKINIYGYADYSETLRFLEKLCDAFDWETYESATLGMVKDGKHSNLKYYTTLLKQWLSGRGMKYVIEEAISYKKRKNAKVYIAGKYVPYDDSVEHRNRIIEDTLNGVNDIIQFRLSNYFMRFSAELKKHRKKDYLTNDWYEYVEYGTTNKVNIFLQKSGFSHEVASYLAAEEKTYIVRTEEGIRLRASVFTSPKGDVRREAENVINNMPELFEKDGF